MCIFVNSKCCKWLYLYNAATCNAVCMWVRERSCSTAASLHMSLVAAWGAYRCKWLSYDADDSHSNNNNSSCKMTKANMIFFFDFVIAEAATDGEKVYYYVILLSIFHVVYSASFSYRCTFSFCRICLPVTYLIMPFSHIQPLPYCQLISCIFLILWKYAANRCWCDYLLLFWYAKLSWWESA